MKTIQVTIDDQPVEVKKLSIGKFAELLKSFEFLPKYLSQFKSDSSNEFLQLIFQNIAECLPDFHKIARAVTNLTQEQIEELGIEDMIVICEAAWKVNNLSAIWERVKKIQAHPPEKSPEVTAQTS